jgi:hypothetical protein
MEEGDFSCSGPYQIFYAYTSTIPGANVKHKHLVVYIPCQLAHKNSSVLRDFVIFVVLEFYGAENVEFFYFVAPSC